MSDYSPQKKLTGWLTLLIVLMGPLQFGGAAGSLKTTADAFRPYIPQYPSLSMAILLYQLFVGGSIACWAYTAWLLYRRERGTLLAAQGSFLLGAALRMVGSFAIVLFGGLPQDTTRSMVAQTLPGAMISGVILVAWYLYLVRSRRVREIYAA
jgi:hypothetical protein